MLPNTPFCVILTNYEVIINDGCLATIVRSKDSIRESLPCETIAYNYVNIIKIY